MSSGSSEPKKQAPVSGPVYRKGSSESQVKLAPVNSPSEVKNPVLDSPAAVAGSWGSVSAVLYTIFMFLVGQFAAAILIVLCLVAKGWGSERAANWISEDVVGQFSFILLAEVLTVAGIVWFLRRRRVPLARIGWGWPRFGHLGTALLGFGVYFVGYIVFATVISLLVPSLDLEQKQEIGFESGSTSLELLLTGISLVILPPLAEEVLFRGFLFGGLRNQFRLLPAAVITSILFGVGHLQFGSEAPLLWVAAIDTFVLSMVLCYIREKTGSLWPGIFIHAIDRKSTRLNSSHRL